MRDYVPQADASDVDRIVRRDFPAEVVDRVHALLERYGEQNYHLEKTRVRLAVLKLAAGDLRDLERQIAVASVDFRDVVGAAEYPSQMRLGFTGMEKTSPDKLQELREADWGEYSAWFNRDGNQTR